MEILPWETASWRTRILENWWKDTYRKQAIVVFRNIVCARHFPQIVVFQLLKTLYPLKLMVTKNQSFLDRSHKVATASKKQWKVQRVPLFIMPVSTFQLVVGTSRQKTNDPNASFRPNSGRKTNNIVNAFRFLSCRWQRLPLAVATSHRKLNCPGMSRLGRTADAK